MANIFLLFLFWSSYLIIPAGCIPWNFDEHYEVNSDAVTDFNQVRRRITASNTGTSKQQSCVTGNRIFYCRQCQGNWADDRQHLADCSIGYGKNATGGKGGRSYVVTDSSDQNLTSPKPGTLRHALVHLEPLWITFLDSMIINLSGTIYLNSFKTIDGRGPDGRGRDVHITGKGCLMLEDVSNVIIHGIHIFKCVPSESACIIKSETQVKHAGRSMGNGISIIRSHNIWVDNCTFSDCTNDLIDATQLSAATFSNNLYFKKTEMLIFHINGHNGINQVTTLYNHFGEQLTKTPSSRNNNENGSAGTMTNAMGSWYKVVIAVLPFFITFGGLRYYCFKRNPNNNTFGNGNVCCNCFNGIGN